MAIIPGDMRIVWLSPAVDLTERRTNKINSESEAYTMSDIVDTVSGEIPTGVNPSSTFLPINESDAFADSPIFATKGIDKDGYNLLETKINDLNEFPVGGIWASPSWGISAELNFASAIQRVQLGDFDGYQGTGKFEWSTGGNAPDDASYIKFDTYGYDLFESTFGYFKLDAKTGNPSRVDGLFYNLYSGIMGFGRGLDANTRSSSEASIVWDVYTNVFEIKGSFGDTVFYNRDEFAQTYIQQSNSKLGLEAQAMYISDDLTLTTSVSGSYTKVLNVRDASGNSYAIKLHEY